MPIITFVDHTIPVAADFNDSYSFVNTEVRTFERGGTGLSSYTKGDILYASATNTVAKLPIAVYGAALGVSSSGLPAWSRPLSKNGADASYSGVTLGTACTLLGAPLIAGNTLGTANRIRITIRGIVSNNNGLGNIMLDFLLKYGTPIASATVLTTVTTPNIANGTTNQTLSLVADLCADASAAAQIGRLTLTTGGGTAVKQGTGTAAQDSTADKNMDVVVTASAGTFDASVIYTVQYAMMELLI